MPKNYSSYVCQSCGYSSPKWAGKCPNCNEWNTLVETIERKTSGKGPSRAGKSPALLSSVPSEQNTHRSTLIPEFDRVLGGGIVQGQVILLAGEPGIGKSTILMQLAQTMGTNKSVSGNIVYVAGEESASQLKLRADRLKVKTESLWILEETDVDEILASLDSFTNGQKISLVIVDSVQTLNTSDLTGGAGSVGQVRESAFRLTQWAKHANVPVILVGQVTKEGTVAGPATLAHMVDTVLWFEGDKNLSLRMLRSIKNRFGPTDEVGIFEMQETGLISITDTHLLIRGSETGAVAGTMTAVILEGSRPILVEVQALVVSSKLPNPRRVAQGIDSRRLEVILAVLTKHARLNLSDCDVFVNIAGGVAVRETGADLAVALAVASSYREVALPVGLIAIGEVGLLGEVRAVAREKDRLKEAKRQGFTKFVSIQNAPNIKEVMKKYLT